MVTDVSEERNTSIFRVKQSKTSLNCNVGNYCNIGQCVTSQKTNRHQHHRQDFIFHIGSFCNTSVQTHRISSAFDEQITIHLKICVLKYIHSFIHTAVCLRTDPQPPPKQVSHSVRSSISSFNFQYPLVSLRSSSSCIRLLPCLSVTSLLSFSFLTITCFRRQFLRKMWLI